MAGCRRSYPAVAELRFPSESPLVFEWAETDKLEPVQDVPLPWK